ncbi:Na(+)/H(+) antiporter NhaA [compost metagenome]
MSIFIANLAFAEQELLSAAKLGVLIASVVAGLIGLAYGVSLVRAHKRTLAKHSAENCPL